MNEMAESELVKYLKYMSSWGFPCNGNDVRRIAGDYLRQIDQSRSDPSVHWLTDFLKRHQDLSWRKGRTIDVMRASVAREVINDFYDLLEDTYEVRL